MKVKKRDDNVVRYEEYDENKIRQAVISAFEDIDEPYDDKIIGHLVMNIVEDIFSKNWNNGVDVIDIETIQDIVERNLMHYGYFKVAKAYITYRYEHKKIREFVEEKESFINSYKKSSNTANATVDDNSNVASKNIAIMNNEIHKKDNIQLSRGMIMRKLKELYPKDKSKQYIKDLQSHIIYKNDESSFAGAIAPYCVSISMYPFLLNGIRDLGGLSAAPKNIDSYCGMYVNLIFAVASQFAGAVATSEFLLYFDYFARQEWGEDYYKESDSFYKIGYKLRKLLNRSHYWTNNVVELAQHDFGSQELNDLRDEIVFDSNRPLTEEELNDWIKNVKDNPNYKIKIGDGTRTIKGQMHQYFQQVVYSINQPAAARGMQAAFVNFSYFDENFFHGMFDNFIFPDMSTPIWETLSWLQKEFMQWFNEERLRTVLTFPVESFALVYKDGKFLDEDSAMFVAQEYARGHSFFTYISDSVDSLSSCCRLKNKLTTHEFNFTNGNMGVETGSKSVITLNLNRIIQDVDRKYGLRRNGGWKENTSFISKDLCEILERVYRYHHAYNELLWDMYNSDLLPAYNAGFIALNKQYLTIGINGLNEAAEYLGMECSDNDEYATFCEFIFSTIKEDNLSHKVTTGHQMMFNTECVPAESLAIKNYNWDKADGYWVPEDRNLYASYIYKPNDDKRSVLEKIHMHGSKFIGDYLDGGSAAHINLDAHLSEKQYMTLLKYAAEQGCQYLTFNIPMSECKKCHHIVNAPIHECPKCGSKDITYWTRIIGYLTSVPNWSKGRQDEFETRIFNSDVKNIDKYSTFKQGK